MKKIWSKIKPYLRYCILVATLFFLWQALREHWDEVTNIHLDGAGLTLLITALGITLWAHIWSGWIWCWILAEFHQKVSPFWGIQAYLITNIAKYIPGNVWHFYARIMQAIKVGVPGEVATVSVLLEPLLMVASALLIAIIGIPSGNKGLQILCLITVLLGIHPRVLDPIVFRLKQLKTAKKSPISSIGKNSFSSEFSSAKPVNFHLRRYPLFPLLGELCFLGLRGTGFVITFVALNPLSWEDVPQLLSAFSFAWLLGLVVPGAPGGVGVFEATAVALLQSQMAVGWILASVGFYRLISILAEVAGAGLAWLDQRVGKIH